MSLCWLVFYGRGGNDFFSGIVPADEAFSGKIESINSYQQSAPGFFIPAGNPYLSYGFLRPALFQRMVQRM